MSRDDERRQFENEWRAWLERPTRLSPQHAAARVRAVAGSAPRRPWTLRWAVAGVTVVVALLAVVLSLGHRPLAPRPAVRPAEGVVVMWLDEDTPLYMNLEPLPVEGSNPS